MGWGKRKYRGNNLHLGKCLRRHTHCCCSHCLGDSLLSALRSLSEATGNQKDPSSQTPHSHACKHHHHHSQRHLSVGSGYFLFFEPNSNKQKWRNALPINCGFDTKFWLSKPLSSSSYLFTLMGKTCNSTSVEIIHFLKCLEWKKSLLTWFLSIF